MSENRGIVRSEDIASRISRKVKPAEASRTLIAKIVELYLQEKQRILESGSAVLENETASRYQIRNYGRDGDGRSRFTVKIQTAVGSAYKQRLIDSLENDTALRESYSQRNPDRFASQVNACIAGSKE